MRQTSPGLTFLTILAVSPWSVLVLGSCTPTAACQGTLGVGAVHRASAQFAQILLCFLGQGPVCVL